MAKVVARHCPQIQLEVLATEGSQANLELIEEKKVQLAILQSDTPLTPSTKAISFLFSEMFHLIVNQQSGIEKVSDLKGKRAEAYYNQDKPSFIVVYAETMGLLLSISVLCF